jgi:NTP pyrophosphatase (non-canonical NTP hydrolase)
MANSALEAIWKDQYEFNRFFFPVPEEYEDRCRQTKEYVLCASSELHELLNAVRWKNHRRKDQPINVQQVRNELTDVFKYWISLAQVWGLSPEDVLKDYWRKSMVCRQRYAEEYVVNLKGDLVLCDIDGVLCDYRTGLLTWLTVHKPACREQAQVLLSKKAGWVGYEEMEMDPQVWQEMKHDFRTSRGKVGLPLYPYAREMLTTLKAQGMKIILCTSRPIDAYPNIYLDTLEWLRLNDLPFDFIWWSTNKAETVLEKGIAGRVKLVIEDDIRFALYTAKLGLKTLWLDRMGQKVEGVWPETLVRVNETQLMTTVKGESK